jgi:SAM-dependent methyltransferase
VPLYHQDARSLELSDCFDACVSLFDSLNYLLEPEGLFAAFAGVHRHLRPGGYLIFDMNAIRALEKGMFDQEGFGRDDSLYYVWESSYASESRLCEVRMRFRVQTPAGPREFHEVHVQRGYTIEEVSAELTRAAFEIVAVHDSFTFRPPTPRTDRLHFVARRPQEPL